MIVLNAKNIGEMLSYIFKDDHSIANVLIMSDHMLQTGQFDWLFCVADVCISFDYIVSMKRKRKNFNIFYIKLSNQWHCYSLILSLSSLCFNNFSLLSC